MTILKREERHHNLKAKRNILVADDRGNMCLHFAAAAHERPYPTLQAAFLQTLQREMIKARLPDTMRPQIFETHRGASIGFFRQNERHVLSWRKLIGEPDDLKRLDIFVWQNHERGNCYRPGGIRVNALGRPYVVKEEIRHDHI